MRRSLDGSRDWPEERVATTYRQSRDKPARYKLTVATGLPQESQHEK